MAKRPQERYQSAKDLAADLRHWLKMERNEIIPGLRTGMIDAVPIPAIQAELGQVYTLAPNMLN